MKIDIVFPRAGRPRGGIADHTSLITSELAARGHDVRVIGEGSPENGSPSNYVNGWPSGRLRDLSTIELLITARQPDAVIVQFEQFSYGHRGYNPEFSRIFRNLEVSAPGTLRVLYAHEAYTSPGALGRTAMWAYQRQQAIRLVRHAHVVIHSSHRGIRLLGNFNENSLVLPVHSNIPQTGVPQAQARAALGLSERQFVTLAFGFLDAPRVRLIRAAYAHVAGTTADGARLLYVGKDVTAAQALLGPNQKDLTILERPSAEIVSTAMSASDLSLSPYPDGVSSRRGTFAAMMHHRLPTVTNLGKYTDEYLVTAAAHGAFALAPPGESAFAGEAASLAASPMRRRAMKLVMAELFKYGQTPRATVDALEATLETTRERRAHSR